MRAAYLGARAPTAGALAVVLSEIGSAQLLRGLVVDMLRLLVERELLLSCARSSTDDISRVTLGLRSVLSQLSDRFGQRAHYEGQQLDATLSQRVMAGRFSAPLPPPPTVADCTCGAPVSVISVPWNTAGWAREPLDVVVLPVCVGERGRISIDFTLSMTSMSVGAEGLLPIVARLQDDRRHKAQHARTSAQALRSAIPRLL